MSIPPICVSFIVNNSTNVSAVYRSIYTNDAHSVRMTSSVTKWPSKTRNITLAKFYGVLNVYFHQNFR